MWSIFDASSQLFDRGSFASISLLVDEARSEAFGIDHRLAANIWAIASQLDDVGDDAVIDDVVTSPGLSALIDGTMSSAAAHDVTMPVVPTPAGATSVNAAPVWSGVVAAEGPPDTVVADDVDRGPDVGIPRLFRDDGWGAGIDRLVASAPAVDETRRHRSRRRSTRWAAIVVLALVLVIGAVVWGASRDREASSRVTSGVSGAAASSSDRPHPGRMAQVVVSSP
jgi:hypothetical protein